MAASILIKRPDLKSQVLSKLRRLRLRRAYGAFHIGDARMDRILEIMKSRPWEQVARKIASVPEIRRGKVFNMRYKIAKGTYPSEERMGKVADRVLEQLLSECVKA